jgi:hypothetical protein
MKKILKVDIRKQRYKGWGNNYSFTCGCCGDKNNHHVVEYSHNENHHQDCEYYDTDAGCFPFKCSECGSMNIDRFADISKEISCSCEWQEGEEELQEAISSYISEDIAFEELISIFQNYKLNTERITEDANEYFLRGFITDNYEYFSKTSKLSDEYDEAEKDEYFEKLAIKVTLSENKEYFISKLNFFNEEVCEIESFEEIEYFFESRKEVKEYLKNHPIEDDFEVVDEENYLIYL